MSRKSTDMGTISRQALALYRALGGRAEAEVAQKQKQSALRGDAAGVAEWRAIRLAIRAIRATETG